MRLYPNIHAATFLSRPNRFIAQCCLDGKEIQCHVKNTGRCRELLVPGAEVYVTKSDNPARKTQYDLVTVRKGDVLVNLDSQAPNRVFHQWAESGHFLPHLTDLWPEVTYGQSRLDFGFATAQGPGFVEVKGVTLEMEGIALFPDAPTQRGVKHVEELLRAAQAGYQAFLCFVIPLPGLTALRPNDATHPAFGQALVRAQRGGVSLVGLGCDVTADGFAITHQVPILLPEQEVLP